MGSLIVKKVIYSGEKYSYESPELNEGINIILGDNGSGKSTFSYFIEYALGGKIKPFDDDNDDARYSLIIEDENNYVQLEILIDQNKYSIKRFINQSEIFVDDGISTEVFPVNRNGNVIFSDWLLKKLNIPVFELYLGATHWYFNFNDLFRLLNYDQNTEPRKIYKSPVAENFVADSIVVRKSIFEILLGISSADYFKKLDLARAAMKKRDVAKALLENYKSNHEIVEDYEKLDALRLEKNTELERLEIERNDYLKVNTTVDDKIGELSNIQLQLIDLELKNSQDRILLSKLQNEKLKVTQLHEGLLQEIHQIQKIIFTHDKLDLFSMEVCPFCMNKKETVEGACICGSKFKDDDYEKFVYNSSEYKDILAHKQKSITAIELAKETYEKEAQQISEQIKTNISLIDDYKEKLKTVIGTAEFAGNSTVVDTLNEQIINSKEQLLKIIFDLKNSVQLKKLKDDFDEKNKAFGIAQASLNRAKADYDKNNTETIGMFNEVYNDLLGKSSYESKEAFIDEDYMPFIDNKEYKANSSDVPKRLMYYFSILSLALKLPSVKHPRFLLIDTPEDSGIDTAHLNQNLELLEEAIKLGEQEDGTIKPYQVILTTGYGKFPESFEKYVVERFFKEDGIFILKSNS
ncbi:hypothetical protein BBI01_01230 [Chryseobacterium artocarpi]|uniref:Rad50/SbcC-type AAA domain-containing protein n=1 Tax=Chryseobacterium artocarpi TaxID=1414727 RepID=A0A1B8ZZZ9_9FLAO|nr:AAA family ATPase [Chryseobacterium artocarpi]OCA77114.1 hypothetical protein BBI01_01230 [Chryseobacterium artocarpi]